MDTYDICHLFTQPQFEARIFYTRRCVNSRQKLSIDNTTNNVEQSQNTEGVIISDWMKDISTGVKNNSRVQIEKIFATRDQTPDLMNTCRAQHITIFFLACPFD